MLQSPRIARSKLFLLFIVLVAAPLYFFVFGSAPSAEEFRSDHPAIILDLGGVLMSTKRLTSARYLGLKRIMWYYFTSGHIKNIRSKFYMILNKINGSEGNLAGATDDEGTLLPELMCEWLRGTRTCQDLRTTIKSAIHTHPEWFSSYSEQLIVERLANLIFTPEIFVETQEPNNEGIEFIKECKKRGYLVYVLSNWDHESFDLLVNKYHDFFKLFDGIVISGDVHAIKPEAKIYEIFTSRLAPHHCVFIDDRIENIVAAEKQGIFGILCTSTKTTFGKKPNFKKIRKTLYAWEKSLLPLANPA